jgi:hypothetical protein
MVPCQSYLLISNINSRLSFMKSLASLRSSSMSNVRHIVTDSDPLESEIFFLIRNYGLDSGLGLRNCLFGK